MADNHTHGSRGWSRRSFLRTAGIAAGVGFVGVPTVIESAGRAAASEHVTTTEHVIESFDGTDIAATLYRPGTAGPHAAVLMTHGFGSSRASVDPLARFYARRDFAVLAYDSRGFGESGGAFTSTGPAEVGDARSLISWLADREGIRTDEAGDPVVAMDGGSYGGGIQLRTAANDDRLDAIVPRITWHDLVATFDPNDVFKVAWWNALQLAAQDDTPARSVEEISETVAPPDGFGPAADRFYRSRSPVAYLHRVETPTLLIHSWYDRLFPPGQALANFRGLRFRGVESALVMQDAGGHNLGGAPAPTRTESGFVANAALSWLDAHLRGDGEHGLAPVNLYDASRDEFLEADRFPPRDASPRSFDLDVRGSARVRNLPAARPDEERVAFDVPIESRTEIVGTPELEGAVVSTGRGTTRLFVGLQHVSGGEATTLKSQVTPLELDRREFLDLELEPTHAVFEPGDVLRIVVATRDEHVLDLELPPIISDTALFVDTDERSGAALLDLPFRPAELTVHAR